MDKQNVFKSCTFHADTDDVVHVLIKDLTGTLPDIELVDSDGNKEDGLYANPTYGALYNWHTANDPRNICNVGWHVPTVADSVALMLYLDPAGDGGTNTAGGKLKETGLIYWDSPNTGADNSTNFNGRGVGRRFSITGAFVSQKQILSCWTSDEMVGVPLNAHVFALWYNSNTFTVKYTTSQSNTTKTSGLSLRLIKDSTTLTHGQTGTYMGNNGKVYHTICIGTQEWLSENLIETKFRDGSSVPIVEDNAAWIALITAGMCYYNNDINNA